MKKLFLVSIFALFAMSSFGQRPQGHISIIPRVGLDIANLSGNKIYYLDSQSSPQEKSMNSKYNARFAGGVDFEYQVLPMSSVSLGAYYSQQGCRFPDFMTHSASSSRESESMEKTRWKLDYVQVPLMFNQYIAEGLAVKVGVQMGFLMNAKVTYTLNETTFDKEGAVLSEKKTAMEDDIKKTLNTMDISIPIGASYEYQNVILDLRYNWGLKSIYKEKDMPKEKNSFLLFTVGYRVN